MDGIGVETKVRMSWLAVPWEHGLTWCSPYGSPKNVAIVHDSTGKTVLVVTVAVTVAGAAAA